MREAIRLARRGLGKTDPNPAVGCVLVRQGHIIARGWHRRAGLPHAEIEALRALPDPALARGAVAYVTLEPCSTHGRTPPCTDALLHAGIRRVVIGATDPNPAHRGRGLQLLRQAGTEVTSGVLADACAALNPVFHHTMATGLPWVIAKCGMSLDGRLTRPPGESPWITSPAARRDAMKLRASADAVMVGAGTVRADDPALTVRGLHTTTQPLRVIWAPRRPPPESSQLLRDTTKAQTLVLRYKTLRAALRALARQGVRRVLLEGGGHTLGRAFEDGLVCEAVFYIAPLLAGGAVPAVGGRGAARPVPNFPPQADYRRIGNCLRITTQILPSTPTSTGALNF